MLKGTGDRDVVRVGVVELVVEILDELALGLGLRP
jgi:hypothetical protein